MFSGLFIILLPLVVGYLLPLRHSSALKLINRMLSWIVYVILFFMGISLAFLDNLASNLLAILHYAAVSVVIILLCNIAALLWLESKMPWRSQHRQEKLPSRLAMALESLQTVRCGRARFSARSDQTAFFTARDRSQRIYVDLSPVPRRYPITQ